MWKGVTAVSMLRGYFTVIGELSSCLSFSKFLPENPTNLDLLVKLAGIGGLNIQEYP